MSGITENLSAVLHGPKDLRIENRPLAAPGPGQAIVKIIANGLCGSDSSCWLHGGMFGTPIQGPLTLGHECAGILHALPEGKETTEGNGLRVGARVVVKPGLPCRECEQCKAGYENRCVSEKYFAASPTNGGMCQYFVAEQDSLLAIPDQTSWKAAGAIQPLAIAVQVSRMARFKEHKRCAIIGAGPIGQLCCSVAKAYGVETIVLTDVSHTRVDFSLARKHARPEHAWHAEKLESWDTNASPQQKIQACQEAKTAFAESCKRKELPAEFDLVIEASGSESGAIFGMELVAMGGTCESLREPKLRAGADR